MSVFISNSYFLQLIENIDIFAMSSWEFQVASRPWPQQRCLWPRADRRERSPHPGSFRFRQGHRGRWRGGILGWVRALNLRRQVCVFFLELESWFPLLALQRRMQEA